MPTFDPTGRMTEAFIASHGGNPIRSGRNTPILLPDGAWLTPGGQVLNDPPADPQERARKRRAYHAARLARTTADRKHLAHALNGNADPFRWPVDRYGPAPQSGEAALAELDALITTDTAMVARLNDEIGPTRFA